MTLKSNLQHSIDSGDQTLTLVDDTTALCAELAAPSHAFATLYTISLTERVLVTGCDADGRLSVTRGVEGTTARAWPAGVCIRVDEVIEGEVCGDDTDNDGAASAERCDFEVGKGLEWDTSDPDNPRLSLTPTGVMSDDLCGATVDECGRLTFIPPNWPQSCIAPLDACCEKDAGSGGTVDACDVVFTTQTNSGLVSAADVCGALDQLIIAVDSLGGADSGVLSVTAGDCIQVTGTAGAPVISVSPSGIMPGTYGGFVVNQCGQITDYTAPDEGALDITGTNPITVNVSALDGSITVEVATAGIGQMGVVTIADLAEIGTPTNINPDDVITFEFLEAYLSAQGLI